MSITTDSSGKNSNISHQPGNGKAIAARGAVQLQALPPQFKKKHAPEAFGRSARIIGELDHLARACHSRLRGWLSAFHGVATRYLPSYLGWRWILDARRIISPESLLKATMGSFPHMMVT